MMIFCEWSRGHCAFLFPEALKIGARCGARIFAGWRKFWRMEKFRFGLRAAERRHWRLSRITEWTARGIVRTAATRRIRRRRFTRTLVTPKRRSAAITAAAFSNADHTAWSWRKKTLRLRGLGANFK